MLNIINDIVDISKIESGQMKLENRETNINEQLDYIYNFFMPEVEAKGIGLSLKNALSVNEVNMFTDSEKIYAILTNLVKNAIKYTNEGTIEFGYVVKNVPNPASLDTNYFLEFYVKDSGIGIPQDRRDAIFERFIQADILDKMARQGAGLGLAITKAYVEMLGGKIWVESELGKGSTFYFTLPFNPVSSKVETQGSQKTKKSKDINFRKRKILIVEDDQSSYELLSIEIGKYCSEILIAKNGTEAIEVFRNNPDVDLIFMDIQLPEMSGYEVTWQIRQFNKEVLIIAITAFALSGDRNKALAAGCNDYLSKPVLKSELVELIRKYFERQSEKK
jgi:CheY-like chemotaxis protein